MVGVQTEVHLATEEVLAVAVELVVALLVVVERMAVAAMAMEGKVAVGVREEPDDLSTYSCYILSADLGGNLARASPDTIFCVQKTSRPFYPAQMSP